MSPRKKTLAERVSTSDFRAGVLRRGFLILQKGSAKWFWMRDCKHKKAPPEVLYGR